MRRQCGLNAAETGHLGKDFRTRCALGSGWRSRVCIWLVFPVEEAGGSQSSCVHEKYLKTLLKTQFSWPRLQRSRISRSAMDPRMLILKWAHQVIRHRQSSGALWDGLRSLLRKCLLTYWQVWWSSVGGKMETNVLKITYLHSVHAIALSLLALDQGAPVVQIFFQIKNTRSHTIVLWSLGGRERCPYLLSLQEAPEGKVCYEAIRGRKTKRRYSSMRSGNEEDGNGKEREKSSQIWRGGNLFVKETSHYLTCFEKARLPAFLISGLLAFEIAQLGILKFWCVLFAC